MAVESHNKKLGRLGEKKAFKYLKDSGYVIVKRNYVNPFGEVDIIARNGEVTAFIEVKTRLSDTFGTPSEAVDEKRKLRYIRAANYFFYGKEPDCTIRFDVIEIYKDKLNHIENAFSN